VVSASVSDKSLKLMNLRPQVRLGER